MTVIGTIACNDPSINDTPSRSKCAEESLYMRYGTALEYTGAMAPIIDFFVANTAPVMTSVELEPRCRKYPALNAYEVVVFALQLLGMSHVQHCDPDGMIMDGVCTGRNFVRTVALPSAPTSWAQYSRSPFIQPQVTFGEA